MESNKSEETIELHSLYTNEWLVNKVKSVLLSHRGINAISTEVSAKDGTVTLRGEASSAAQKDLVTEYTKDVEGVKNVENVMTVAKAAATSSKKSLGETIDAMGEKLKAVGESMDDSFITALVKTTLLYRRSTSALNTSVNSKDGVVNLAGKARNAAEKELTTKLVSDVHGVKRVVNNMTVEGPESTIRS